MKKSLRMPLALVGTFLVSFLISVVIMNGTGIAF